MIYTNEINECGHICYLCAGVKTIPDTADPVTDKLSVAIEVTESYAPRFIDKFFGRYAVLLDTPSARQIIKKDLVLAGVFTRQKEISSKIAVFASGGNSYTFKGIVKVDGHTATGAYLHNLLVNEIAIRINSTFSFTKQDRELAKVTEDSVSCGTSLNENAWIGAVHIKGYDIYNTSDVADEGCIRINYHGTEGGGTKYRDFAAHDGKAHTTPASKVIGHTTTLQVGGLLSLQSTGRGIDVQNTAYARDNVRLTNLIAWHDSVVALLVTVGFDTADSFRFMLRNIPGSIVFVPLGVANALGTLKINGKSVFDTYVTIRVFTEAMGKEVDVVEGGQLSTEDLMTGYRRKLATITTRELAEGGEGCVTPGVVTTALKMELSADGNLSDVTDKAAARKNIDTYSEAGIGEVFLEISEGLKELVCLTADEISGLTAEEVVGLKAERQMTVRDTLDAEKKGTGELKLARTSNLSDLPDKGKACKNLEVYSMAEIDRMMDGKLGADSTCEDIVFTPELRDKLLGIKTGSFVYMDEGDISHAQAEGYAMTPQVVRELKKKAGRLMGGYNTFEKGTIATSLNLYTKARADVRFVALRNPPQDYIGFLTEQGKSPMEARQLLRNKLGMLSKDEIVKDYLRKGGELSDLSLPTAKVRRQACCTIGATHTEEYQPLPADTRWMHMENSGSGTDAQGLFICQIRNIVPIQGCIDTVRRDGNNWGDIVTVIPNRIQLPRYSVRYSIADWSDDHKYNRGSSSTIYGGSRGVQLYECDMYNVNMELNFTYFV